MKQYKYLLIGLFGVLLCTACSNDTNNDFENQIETATDDPADVLRFSKSAEAYVGYETDFALEMLRHLEASSNETTAISPLGFYEVLAMIANADDDVVAPEIINVLTQGNLNNLDALNEYNRIMMKVLPNLDKSVTLYNNNALAYQKNLQFDMNYLNRMQKNFLPEMIEYDKADGNMHLLINDWAAKTTNNVIQGFLSNPLSCDLVILNSNYIKGDWKYPFSDDSHLAGFENYDKTESYVPYFEEDQNFPSFNAEGVKGVEFPIGNGNFSFIALRPADYKADISQVTSKLNRELLEKLLAQASTKEIYFCFPKFDIDGETFDYSHILRAMGINKLFTSSINGIFYDMPAFFNVIVQKSNISICRTGMEAASVTASFMVGSSGIFNKIPDEIEFAFCRPFVFLIRENSTGAILFVGQVKSLPNQDPFAN